MHTHPAILVAIDSARDSTVVLQTALTIAAPTDSRLHVLRVGERPRRRTARADLPFPTQEYDLAVLAEELEPTLSLFRRFSIFVRTPVPELHFAYGEPAAEIVRLAAQLDVGLIVIGAHERHGLRSWVHGSVAGAVARLAGCGVVIVRPKSHDPALVLPEVLALCADCAELRAVEHDEQLYCARHSEHHARAHGFGHFIRGDASLHAYSSMTGS